MLINFNNVDRISAEQSINVRETTTSNSHSSAKSAEGSRISLDISSSVTDNSAYKGHGKTVKDVMKSAEAIDVDAQRDYLTVMSNCVSEKDLQKIQEGGFDPSEMRADEAVSIVDHIKAALIKGGTEVQGYTDTVSPEALKEITGSETYAKQLDSLFEMKDIPLTEQNAEEITKTFKTLQDIDALTEAGVKYLIENELEINAENLYKATYSSGNNAMMQGHGYYQAGEGTGYLAKKSEEMNLDSLLPQIEKIIEDSGYEVTEDTVSEATWLINRGIPLTKDTFGSYKDIDSLKLPMSFEEFADHATDGIMDGVEVRKASLTAETSLRQKAFEINEEVQTLGTIKGRRVLEEVRLSMTTEANLKLLRSGFSIDTAPMEELVKNLKEIEKEFAINLTGDDDEIEAVRKKDIFDTTVDLVDIIRRAPISISLSYEKEDSFEVVGRTAEELTRAYEKAAEGYETMMTAPRADLGDSIRKAFQNVDDILEEMNRPLTEENRRAVRILGYNSIEITDENLDKIKDKDTLLHETISRMTPGRVLTMIRENVNPLSMSVENLKAYLDNQDTTKEDMLSYSRFLYRLEENRSITEDEREAYIGIYRLVNQIEKGDFSAVGAIEEMGVEMNFENILSVMRSRKHRAMDYKVDDSFGGVDAIDRGIASITSQIARGYMTDVSDLKQVLEEAADDRAAGEYERVIREDIERASRVEDDVIRALSNMDTPVTVNNLLGMEAMMDRSSSVFDRLKEIGYRKKTDVNLSSKKEAAESYKEFTGSVKEFISDRIFNNSEDLYALRAMDIRELSKTFDLMNFLEKQSDEENYEIPANIGGELTAINLKVIHSETESKVAIAFETKTFGKVASELSYDEGLTGYISCSAELSKRLEQGSVSDRLEKEGLLLKDCRILTNEDLNLREFENKVTKDRKPDTGVISTDKLYKAAKAIIGYVEDVTK